MRSARFCINTPSASSRHLHEKGQIVWLSERSAFLHLRTPLAKFRTKKKRPCQALNKGCYKIAVEKKNQASKNHPRKCCMHQAGCSFKRKRLGPSWATPSAHWPLWVTCPVLFSALLLLLPPACPLLHASSSPLLQSCFHSLKVRTKGYPAHAKDRQQGQLCVLLSWRKPCFP